MPRSTIPTCIRRVLGTGAPVVLAVVSIVLAASLPGLAQTRPAPIAVTLAQATDSIIHGPIYIARAKHYFEDEGLDVNLVITGGASNAIAAVISGSAQIASAGLSDNINAAVHGRSLVAFATLTRRDSDNIVIAKSVAEAKHITSTTPTADKVKALVGLRIGISSVGAAPDQVLHWLLTSYGLNPERDVQTVPVHDPSTALSALSHGAIDGFVFGPPAPEAAVQAGIAVVLIDVAHGEVSPGYRIDLMATKAYLDANPEVGARVTRAIGRAEALIQSDPKQAQELMQSFFPKMPPAAFASAWADMEAAFAPTPAVSPADVNDVLQFMTLLNGTRPNVVPDSLVTNRFVQTN